MALDPESQRLLDLMAAANRPAWHTLSPQAARDPICRSARRAGSAAQGVTVADRTIPGPAGASPCGSIGRPRRSRRQAAGLVYAHGGGFVFGNLDSHDVLCAQLALDAGIAVFAVDYRLAPEARFPGAFDDMVAALKWVAANGASVGIEPRGWRSAATAPAAISRPALAIWARDNAGPKLRLQLLAYPVTDAVARTKSYRRYYDGYGLNAETMEWFFDHYTPDKSARGDWRVSPLRATSLAGLAPALVVTAGYDPLRDEGRAYAWRLQQDGTLADLAEFGGMLHGFLCSPMLLHGARRGVAMCAAALKEALVLRAG